MVSAASADGPGQLRRAVSLSDDPLGPLGGDSDKGGDAGPSTSGTSIGRLQPGYFDLTRRTAEGVERAQAATSPSVRLPKLSPRTQDASTTSLDVGPSSIRSSRGSRSDDLLSVTTAESGTSPSRRSHSSSRDRSRSDAEAEQREGTTTPTEDDEVGALSTPRLRRNTTVRSRNRARAVSMIMLDGGADPEDAGAADEGEAAIAQEPSPSLLQSFHRMTDAELIKHSGKEMPAALSLLRAASRALYEAREEVLTLEHDLASARTAQEEERSTSLRREKALMQLCKEYGAGDGVIERSLARISKQETIGQKLAEQQKQLGSSLQEAMDDSLGDGIVEEDVANHSVIGPIVIDHTGSVRSGRPESISSGKSRGPPSASNASTKSSVSSKAHRQPGRRPRSDSVASSSVASVAASSRKAEGKGITDWASSLMPWGAGTKKGAVTVSPTTQEDVSWEISVGEASTDEDAESRRGAAERTRRPSRSSSISSRKAPSTAGDASTPSTNAARRARQTSRTLSIFGGIAWRRGAPKGPSAVAESSAGSDDDESAAEESAELRPSVGDLDAPATTVTWSASDRPDHDGEELHAATVRATNPVLVAKDESTVRARLGKAPGRTTAADALRLRGDHSTSAMERSHSSSSSHRVPNVTRVPQIYGTAAANPDLPLTAAPVKTLELKPMIPKEARPPTLAGLRLDGAPDFDDYEAGSDPFEVYGGDTSQLQVPAPAPTQADSALTDRYGFMYAATPADLRLLRQAQEASTPAPACLARTRVEMPPDSEEESDMSPSTEHPPRRIKLSRGSSFLMGHAEKAQASTQATSLTVSTHAIETDEKEERKHTIKALLKQLDELYDEQQHEQRAKWEEYLQERQSKSAPARRRSQEQVIGEEDDSQDLVDDNLHLIGIAQMGTSKTGKEDWQQFLQLCLAGIPLQYRSAVWSECAGAADLAEPGRYDELLSEHDGENNQCVQQIDLDVHRTMPLNVFFGGDGPGVPKLRRLLVAFSWYDVGIGYCQAMNNVAATLLLIDPSEEKSFWLLVCLIEKIMPRDYYTSHLLTSQADQRVLIEYVEELLPALSSHIDSLGVDLPAVTFAWFLSLYTDCLPVEALFRVWDLLFVEGMVTLFRVAVAILKLHEKELVSMDSPASFYGLMHRITGWLFNADHLITTASQLRDQIKQGDVIKRRRVHVEALKGELGL